MQIINFDSIYPKKDELQTILIDENLDFIFGTETHLSEEILDSEFIPQNYQATRLDRNRLGGGVIVIHKSDLSVKTIRKSKEAEFLTIKVECEGKRPLIMSVAYRRPVNDFSYMETLCRLINDTVSAHPNCAHWFCWDFNLPDINWETESITGSQNIRHIKDLFQQTLQSHDLNQVIDFPTRG